MMFGSKKKLPDVDVRSPFGSLITQGNDIRFTPENNPKLNKLESLLINRQMRSAKGLPANMGFDSRLADQLFQQSYQPTFDALKGPLMQQFSQDNENLMNDLSARNQLGSSYDALRHNMMAQQQGQQLLQASNSAQAQARDNANNLALTDVNARVNNNLNTLQVLQGLRNAALSRQLSALQLAPFQQNLMNGLLQSQFRSGGGGFLNIL